ncbi:MAG: phosphate ABC transporter substrate-binding protein PstS [Rhodocyclaceae bacterium]
MRKYFVSSLAAAVLASVSLSAAAAEVTGAGASFPNAIYTAWADAYNKATGNKINYQSVGSGAGLKQIAAKTVDFGASDAPLTVEQQAKDGLVQFPTVIGGVVPVFNLPGIQSGQLKLTGAVLADIYLGKITKWNDKAIKELNPTTNLPDSDIGVVRRADGSGTSFVFTNYLSKVSPEWKTKVGEGTAPQWPVGLGGKGNEGVAAFVQRLPGSIGYVEYVYAKKNKLAYALVQNKDKAFPAPDDETFKAAAAKADWSKGFYEILTDQPGANAWPITAATWIVMQATQDKPAQGAEVLKFFEWAYKNGDKTATDLEFVPLPDDTVKLIYASWAKIKDASGKPVHSVK